MARSNPRSTLRTPHSTLPRGLSLTEVLIAMGILTLGLLGVASVFPVGSFYMQKAEISDKGSAIAQSVFSDIMARGMLNPRAWYVMTPNGSTPVWGILFPSDGKYSPSGMAQAGTFTRPFGLALAEAQNQTNAATDKTILARQFGSAYVIDPLGVSYMAFKNGGITPSSSAFSHGPAAVFPATAYNAFFNYINYQGWSTASPWGPWYGGSKNTYNGYEWPVRRVTFRQPSNGWQMDATVAEHYFRGNDDLTYDFPARDDRPAIQKWDTGSTAAGGITPLSRKWTGDYSWIVTVAPPTNAARDGMATNPEGFAYDVSVVVFYKRVLPPNADETFHNLAANNADYLSAMAQNERAVKANVLSTGLNGGELLLSDWGDVTDPTNNKLSAFEHLRSGQWIMLCGPHPNSSVSEPRMSLNWYQVISIEPATSAMYGYDSATGGKTQRAVSVRGAQWPWQPSSGSNSAGNDLCVAICKGAVAVHTKSIRLESGVSDTTFNNAGGPNTTQNPWYP